MLRPKEPVVGKYLLQRNVIKMGIPVVGVPLAVVVNRHTTLIAGHHARDVFRNDARIIEVAERLTKQSLHPKLTLWVAWLVVTADDKIAEDEATLMRHLVRLVRQHYRIVDDELASVIRINPADVWLRLDAEEGDLSDLIDVAEEVAQVDGPVTKQERAVIAAVQNRCEV